MGENPAPNGRKVSGHGSDQRLFRSLHKGESRQPWSERLRPPGTIIRRVQADTQVKARDASPGLDLEAAGGSARTIVDSRSRDANSQRL
jgi:hypothetical protein